ncbi:hypothetical protein B566_EDAN015212 [Ephemera danica]|nr:hypothetical protein B566_EDAN015212 [Ephemera danica]
MDKVIMALHEKKVPFSSREVQITRGEQYEPWFMQINPKCEVPVLQDGVRVIPDSSRIIDYIEDNFSNGNKPSLVPKNLGPTVRQKVDYFRGILDQLPAGVITMGSFYHPDLCGQLAEENPEYAESLTQKRKLQEQKRQLVEDREQFQKVLAQVDEILAQVEAENVGLSGHLWGPDKRPHITSYLARAQKRESFVKTMAVAPSTTIRAFYHSCPLLIGAGVVLLIALATGFLIARRK